ncbi:MAG: hypothetical protein ABSA84_00375 [Gammaproteobacteria bacterium]
MLAEYAILSRETYLINSGEVTYNLPEGWRVQRLKDPTDKGIWGNRYVVFINDEKKKIVLSVRGTNNIFNVITDVGLALSRINNESFIPPGQSELDNLAEEILRSNLVKTQNYNFKIIGHSLGAVMAELSAVKFGIECIGFESPGSLNIMQRHPNIYSRENFELITSYLSAPNIINTLNSHPGTIYRMYLPHTKGLNGWHIAECLLNSMCTGASCVSVNAMPIMLFSKQATKELAKQIVKKSFLVASGTKLGSKFINWRDEVAWLKTQHEIDNIVDGLNNKVIISKMASWPTIWEELKGSKLVALARDFFPLQKDRPGIRNVFDENGMREARIKRIKGYKEAEEVTRNNNKNFFKYRLIY